MIDELKQAFQLRKQHEFQKAIDIYAPIWKQNHDSFDDWAGWSYAFSLSKLNRHDEALEVCRTLFPRFSQSEILNSLYAKSIFYTQFTRDKSPSIEVLSKATEAMMRLAPPHQPYSLTSVAIFRLIKVLLSQQAIDWKKIEDWLLKMEPDLLNDQPYQMTDARGKQIELASPKEEWYSNMIKVKGWLNQPKELLALLDVARKQNIKWHYNNDLWFARKEAFALNQLGEKDKAEKILRNILKRKKDWFLLYDLSQVIENEKESLTLMARAARSPGKDEHKLKLFQSLYERLAKIEMHHKDAAMHLCLIAAIREEQGWPVKEEMRNTIIKAGIDPVQEGSSLAIKKKLIPVWISLDKDSAKRLTGKVKSILPNGNAGFISCESANYYFRVGNLKNKIKPGTMLSFELEDGFDKKKNKSTKVAVNIQPQ